MRILVRKIDLLIFIINKISVRINKIKGSGLIYYYYNYKSILLIYSKYVKRKALLLKIYSLIIIIAI
jgi:hypothetical protein